jgi:hypothetical protein
MIHIDSLSAYLPRDLPPFFPFFPFRPFFFFPFFFFLFFPFRFFFPFRPFFPLLEMVSPVLPLVIPDDPEPEFPARATGKPENSKTAMRSRRDIQRFMNNPFVEAVD